MDEIFLIRFLRLDSSFSRSEARRAVELYQNGMLQPEENEAINLALVNPNKLGVVGWLYDEILSKLRWKINNACY